MTDTPRNYGDPLASDDAFLLALLGGNAVADAAALCGMTTAHAWARYRDPLFLRELALRRSALWLPAVEESRRAVSRALHELLAIGTDAEVRADTRVKACCALIEYATKLHELHAVEPRLAALEARLDERDD